MREHSGDVRVGGRGSFRERVRVGGLQKIEGPQEAEKRYSPAVCIGAEARGVRGNPDPDLISRYNFARVHKTLSDPYPPGPRPRRWVADHA